MSFFCGCVKWLVWLTIVEVRDRGHWVFYHLFTDNSTCKTNVLEIAITFNPPSSASQFSFWGIIPISCRILRCLLNFLNGRYPWFIGRSYSFNKGEFQKHLYKSFSWNLVLSSTLEISKPLMNYLKENMENFNANTNNITKEKSWKPIRILTKFDIILTCRLQFLSFVFFFLWR